MPTDTNPFRQAVAAQTPRPKAACVSPRLFRQLVAEGDVEDRMGTPGGLHAPIYGLMLPFFDGDVFIACDPRLEDRDLDYQLP